MANELQYKQKIDEWTKGKYSFMNLQSFVTGKSNKSLNFVFIAEPADIEKMTEENISELQEVLEANLSPTGYWKINIKINKSYIDQSYAIQYIINFFNEHHSLFLQALTEKDILIDIKDKTMDVTFKFNKIIIDYLEKGNFREKITEHLNKQTVKKINIDFIETPAKPINLNYEYKESEIFNLTQNLIKVNVEKVLVGKLSTKFPSYIKDNLNEKRGAVITGKIFNFKRLFAKKSGNIFYAFSITDNTGKIECRYFTRKQKAGPLDDIKDGDFVVLSGDIRHDNYIHDLCFYVKSFALCEIPGFEDLGKEKKIKKQTFKEIEIPSDYTYQTVFPEKYVDMEESSLIDFSQEAELPKEFKERIFVVFDLESTGLNAQQDDEIIEIGAIKIADGKIVEKFVTLVKPTKKIPQEATEINKITNRMVANAPSLKDVIMDFKHFTKNAYLVGHNILSFDIPLLNQEAMKVGVKFDNKVMDTYKIAERTLTGRKVSPKNLRLGTIAEFYNIELQNAHRAFDDVLANAKIFIKFARLFDLDYS